MLEFVFLCLLAVTTRASDVDWYTGRWLPVVMYPNVIYEPICNWNNITKADFECICGENNNVPVLNFKDTVLNKVDVRPIFVVNNQTEITNAIALKCMCDGAEKKPTALQKLNDNTYATYEDQPFVTNHNGEPNLAVIAVKKMPTLKELRDLLHSVEHLKTRKPGLLCEPNSFQ